MAGLEGTIKTPLGTVQKKTALYLGGGIAVLAVIVWYRNKQLGGTSSDAVTPEAEINPATGYPYGSAEDAAALAAQAAYVSPSGTTGGGSSSVPVSNAGYSSNGQWTNGVVQNLVGNGLVSDPSQLSVALGKYITGAYATDTEVSLIQQAIAAEGYPPVSGTNGYPPSINRTPPTSTPTSKAVGAISARVTTPHKNGFTTSFHGAANAVRYQVTLDGKLWNEVSGSPFTISGLKSNSRHSIGIRGVGSDGKLGPVSTSNVTTLK